ncbi:hypothetical protein KPL39_04415 [Clostridium gasigenes]|uniref:hypothetical protein n=1 Tax=Clostridium gasigenes TaxID=94869 RepID=UPI001C0C87BE|nr:hypothetical protein [Clostridium gasigenes]MBU3135507.1 hypothetical protein [Clostridium gasigenes]
MKMLYSYENNIDSSYNNSHITYKMILDKDYDSIKITFEYSPKVIESDEKAKDIICSIIDRHVIGDDKEREKNNWEAYKGLKNLLTITLYDSKGFRGCAHRQEQYQEHIITENMASPGIIEGIIPKGEFIIKISIHALVTKECKYNLKVYDVEDENE